MVSLTSAPRYITSASRYHMCYQSRPSIYIRGLIPWNFAELVEVVPIGTYLSPLFAIHSSQHGNFHLNRQHYFCFVARKPYFAACKSKVMHQPAHQSARSDYHFLKSMIVMLDAWIFQYLGSVWSRTTLI